MRSIGIFLLIKFSIARRLWQGLLGIIVLALAAYIIVQAWGYPAKLAERVTTVWWQETLLVIAIILSACYLVGLGIDALRKTRWGHALDHLPTAILEKPEVLVKVSEVYIRGILLGTKNEHLTMLGRESSLETSFTEVFLPTGGPLNPGATAAIILVPSHQVFTTGRKGRDLLQRVITLGGGGNGNPKKGEVHIT